MGLARTVDVADRTGTGPLARIGIIDAGGEHRGHGQRGHQDVEFLKVHGRTP